MSTRRHLFVIPTKLLFSTPTFKEMYGCQGGEFVFWSWWTVSITRILLFYCNLQFTVILICSYSIILSRTFLFIMTLIFLLMAAFSRWTSVIKSALSRPKSVLRLKINNQHLVPSVYIFLASEQYNVDATTKRFTTSWTSISWRCYQFHFYLENVTIVWLWIIWTGIFTLAECALLFALPFSNVSTT